jgi:uncharacterized Tic20 family protein
MSDAFSPPPAPGGETTAEQRQWAMFAHLSALVGGLLTSVVGGWGTFAGPLIIWLIKKDEMPFVNDQAKEALNFNITVAIIALVMTLLTFVTLGIGIIITGPILVIVGIAWLVLTIIAAMKANEGQPYRYPFAIRLIK